MQLKEIRGSITHQAYLPAQATAGTVDNWPVFRAQFDIQVTAAVFVPSAAITANGTNYSDYTLTRYTAGASGTTVATRSWAATNSVAETPESMTLSGTAANLLLSSGDTLSVVKSVGGTGLVIPDGLLVVTYLLTGI